jgi:response regulator of citrate/malate metabolism
MGCIGGSPDCCFQADSGSSVSFSRGVCNGTIARNAQFTGFLRGGKSIDTRAVLMPKLDGMQLLHKLRSIHNPISVIMITAANDLGVIRSTLNNRIIDYIIKPFSFERFSSAIDKFKKRAGFMAENKTERITQTKLDTLLETQQPSPESEPLEKGLNKKTLETIYSWLTAHPTETVTCEALSGQLTLSKVTIRRYMNYLIETGKVKSTVDYETGGRPSITYQLK